MLPVPNEMFDYSAHSAMDKVRNLSCKECEKTYNHSGTLHRHKKTVHGGVRYCCEHCQREFSQSGHLSAHIRTLHSGVGK